jgi:hypothetical protein
MSRLRSISPARCALHTGSAPLARGACLAPDSHRLASMKARLCLLLWFATACAIGCSPTPKVGSDGGGGAGLGGHGVVGTGAAGVPGTGPCPRAVPQGNPPCAPLFPAGYPGVGEVYGACTPGQKCDVSLKINDGQLCLPPMISTYVCCDNGLVTAPEGAPQLCAATIVPSGQDPRCQSVEIPKACTDQGLTCKLRLYSYNPNTNQDPVPFDFTFSCCDGRWQDVTLVADASCADDAGTEAGPDGAADAGADQL